MILNSLNIKNNNNFLETTLARGLITEKDVKNISKIKIEFRKLHWTTIAVNCWLKAFYTIIWKPRQKRLDKEITIATKLFVQRKKQEEQQAKEQRRTNALQALTEKRNKTHKNSTKNKSQINNNIFDNLQNETIDIGEDDSDENQTEGSPANEVKTKRFPRKKTKKAPYITRDSETPTQLNIEKPSDDIALIRTFTFKKKQSPKTSIPGIILLL